MPWIRTEFFRILLKSVPPADAAAMRFDDGTIEPLCAVYSSRCAGFIAPRIKLGQRGVIDFLDKIKVAYLTERALSQIQLDKRIFANINTPEDLIRIESEPGALIRPIDR
jgi:molybdopterin-guanine dinucleotide biosynthesis protein A